MHLARRTNAFPFASWQLACLGVRAWMPGQDLSIWSHFHSGIHMSSGAQSTRMRLPACTPCLKGSAPASTQQTTMLGSNCILSFTLLVGTPRMMATGHVQQQCCRSERP